MQPGMWGLLYPICWDEAGATPEKIGTRSAVEAKHTWDPTR